MRILPALALVALPVAAPAQHGAEEIGEPPSSIPAPTIDTDGDGTPDAWDRNGDAAPDAWDVDQDGMPDLIDEDGDGEPDRPMPEAR